MVRNRGGQHQRRPRLSLMGFVVSTILIRSLSLRLTDWPLYLREPSPCSLARPTPAGAWPRGPSHTAQVTLANQQPMQGAPAEKPVHCLHIHFSLNPMGRFSFCIFPAFFLHFLSLKCYFFFFSSFVTVVYLALLTLPQFSSSRTHTHTHLPYSGNEDKK